jgi:crotonobetainyl-CoA:carnitine CoA-transferase CaiB-like acyl-CoA transferase
VAQAETGMMVANEGQEAPFTIVDTAAGIVLAQAVLAALVKRSRTGRGERVEAALLPTALYLQAVQLADYSLNGTVLTPTERARRAPTASLFRAADGLIYVAAHYEEHWRILCEVLGEPELPRDPRFETRALRVEHGEELKVVLAGLFSTNTRRAWFELLNARGVMVAVVRDYDEVVHDEDETIASWFFDASTSTGEPIKLVATPYRFGGQTFPLRSSPPPLGAHSAAVLRELGYGDDDIRSLTDAKVIAGEPATDTNGG